MANANEQTLVKNMLGTDYAFPTAVDLSARQFTFVNLDTNELVVGSSTGEAAAGILQDNPNGSVKPSQASVRIMGASKLKLGGTVTPGQLVKSDSSGFGVAATVDHDRACARAISGGVSGDLILVVIEAATVSA